MISSRRLGFNISFVAVSNAGRRTGPRACPFNALYWDFIARHREKIGRNPRMAQMVRTYDRFADAEKGRIADSAAAFLAGL